MSVVAEGRGRRFCRENSELKEDFVEDFGVIWWNNSCVVI